MCFLQSVSNRTFVCLDDISKRMELKNFVIYNPNVDGIAERSEKLFRHIRDRFDVALTSEELIELTKYESHQLEEFVEKLIECIRKRDV